MATCYSGMADTSMESPESQDIDSKSQEIIQKILFHFNIETNSRR